MPVNEWIAAIVASTAVAAPCQELDLHALQQQFRAPSNPAHICISGSEFRIISDADQLNSILDSDAFSEQDIAELKALPLRVFDAI